MATYALVILFSVAQRPPSVRDTLTLGLHSHVPTEASVLRLQLGDTSAEAGVLRLQFIDASRKAVDLVVELRHLGFCEFMFHEILWEPPKKTAEAQLKRVTLTPWISP